MSNPHVNERNSSSFCCASTAVYVVSRAPMFVRVDRANSCASETSATASTIVAISTSIRLKPDSLLADERDFANPIDVNPLGDGALRERDGCARRGHHRPREGRPLFLVDRAVRPELKGVRRTEGDAGGEPAHRTVVIRTSEWVVVCGRCRIGGFLAPV